MICISIKKGDFESLKNQMILIKKWRKEISAFPPKG